MKIEVEWISLDFSIRLLLLKMIDICGSLKSLVVLLEIRFCRSTWRRTVSFWGATGIKQTNVSCLHPQVSNFWEKIWFYSHNLPSFHLTWLMIKAENTIFDKIRDSAQFVAKNASHVRVESSTFSIVVAHYACESWITIELSV
jgi:hypothetical protein